MPIPLGILANLGVKGGANYWIGTWDDSNEVRLWDIITDTSNNIYGVGNNRINYEGMVVKVSPSGTQEWQRELSTSLGLGRCIGTGIGLDSSNNVYTALEQESGANGFLVKYNSSGSIQWQRQWSGTSGRGFSLKHSATHTDGTTYTIGRYEYSSNLIDWCLLKWDSTGTLQFQKRLGTASGDYGSRVALDSSGNPHYVGLWDSYPYITKRNTAAASTWAYYTNPDSLEENYGLSIDSSGNVYAAASNNTRTAGILWKLNSSGSLQWQRSIAGTDLNVYSVANDSDGNVIVVGHSTVSSNQSIFIIKFDSSGNTVWQRTMRVGSSGNLGYAVTTDSNKDILIGGQIGDSDSGILAKIPADGSLTGSINLGTSTLEYVVSSYTITTPSHTTRSTSATLADLSQTEQAGSMTDAAGGAVYELTAI